MKKLINSSFNIIIGLLVVILLTRCEKTGQLLDVSSEKIAVNFTKYDSLLNSSPSGWKMLVYPDIKKFNSIKGGFAFFMKFNGKEQTVSMLADFNEKMRTMPNTGLYSLKFTSLTSISFSTYSYINEVGDPNTMVNGGKDLGWGFRVDSEYSFLRTSANQDTIYLKGNLQNCHALLIRAKPEEEKFFYEDKNYDESINSFATATKGKLGLHAKMGEDLIVMTLALDQRQLVLAKNVNEDSVLIHRTGIAYNGPTSILLGEPFENSGHTITEIKVEAGKILVKGANGENIEVIEKDFPSISAFKMLRTGAYSTIKVPFNNERFITGYIADNKDWPNYLQVQRFLASTVGADLGLGFGVITGSVRFYDVSVDFKASQKRFILNVNLGIFDSDNPNAPSPSYKAADEFYKKFAFPYQYRYTYNSDEIMTMFYEGPQFVYAAQFPDLKNAFKDSILDGDYSFKYTKSPTELLVAFYNKRNNQILFEGRPF